CSTWGWSYSHFQPLPRAEIYYYHADHLGSSSWITDQDGEAVQHLCYLPFGEPWIDQRTTGWETRYTFSGKERDEESGYLYFGARYYDSDLSVWLSVDPMSDKKPWITPYAYCQNNPIRLIDPDGRDEWEMNKRGDIVRKNNNGGEDQHTLHAVDKKGNRTGASTEVKDRSVLDQLSKVKGIANDRDGEGTVQESGNIRNATGGRENLDDMLNVFKFAADNTDVEWKFEYGKSNGKAEYSVGTWGLSGSVGNVLSGKNLITTIHSHSAFMVPDNIEGEKYSMGTDRAHSKHRNYNQYVYMAASKRMYNVNKGTSSFIRKVTNSKGFINVGR
ncbi:MAG: hypothetical protein LBV02_03415, partial [Bacteroidales bacterium]|nr:hypothetical protein [Bacteroidales bacterium]